MHPEAIEGLLKENGLAESGFSFEARAAVVAGERALRQEERVRQSERRIAGNEGKKLLPEVFFKLLEIGRLAGRGGAMDEAQRGEPLGVVPSEVAVERLVGVETKELSDDLNGEDLGVGELAGGAALTQGFPVFEPVVHQAEDGYDEGVKIHQRRPPLHRLVWSLPSVGRSSRSFKLSRKPAHGVSYWV
jgi:hypothetical protein